MEPSLDFLLERSHERYAQTTALPPSMQAQGQQVISRRSHGRMFYQSATSLSLLCTQGLRAKLDHPKITNWHRRVKENLRFGSD